MNIVPISKDIIEPVIKSNLLFVNSFEEFEQMELDINETRGAFDNYRQFLYVRSRDKYGDYSPVMIFCYENFAQKIKNIEREEFVKKCKEVGLDEIKTECACRFFLDKMKPYDVWVWVTTEKGKDWSWDYVTSLKCTLKKKLFPKVATI